ncbi:MAG: V-type ATP synthase subunit E family protein [Candidatus Aminicenantes bacterium]|jgi:vacuolar-type H+-ATPase subunit H
MSLEKILKKITDDAQEEAAQIIQESRQKAEKIKEAARQEASLMAEAILKESEKETQLEASRIVTQARLKRKIDILACKKELIHTVLEKAFRRESKGSEGLKKIVIQKEGEREEVFDEQKVMDELRPHLEKLIADLLKI